MRISSLLLWEMRLQAKHGFILLYALLTAIYGGILLAVPASWQEKTAALLIFSDPAAIGLFFMGAMVLLEKSQRTPWAVAVTPMRPGEYVHSKVISLLLLSLTVAAVLSLVAGGQHLLLLLAGTALSSVLSTLLGLIIALRIESLNQFLLFTVPAEILCFLPAILHLFQVTPPWLGAYPFNTCMDMIVGKVPSLPGLLLTLGSILLLDRLAKQGVRRLWRSAEGGKL